jgi:hypothetical protein
MLPPGKDAYFGPYLTHQLARAYVLTGEKQKAVEQLDQLLHMPFILSPQRLRIDPNFTPLRGYPGFEKLLTGS